MLGFCQPGMWKLSTHRPRWNLAQPPKPVYTQEEEEQIKAHLRDLGYL